MDLYRKFIEEKQKEFDNFKGIGFAFSNKQFEEMLIKLNASPKDLYDLGAGTFILKDRYQAFIDLSNSVSENENDSNILSFKSFIIKIYLQINIVYFCKNFNYYLFF